MGTLVIVDVQEGFIRPEYADVPEKIRAHIEAGGYEHVLFGKFANREESNFVKLLGWKKLFGPPDTDIVPELAPYSRSENTFERSTYSLFKSPEFVMYLNRHGIGQLDLCGLVADSCVLATAFEGFDLGYEVRVLRDLMRTREGLATATEEIFKRNIDKNLP